MPIIRYEDFVNTPNDIMNKICELLMIPFNNQFSDLFCAIRLSGESGRKGNIIIESRSRRPVSQQLSEEVETSENYQVLRNLLHYEA